MNTKSSVMWWGLALVVVGGLLLVPIALSDAEEVNAGFEGYIQSGTCEDPNDEFKAELESEDDEYDVEPYVAVGADGEAVTLGYNGSPGVPGFGFSAIYTDQQFSLVIAEPGSDEPVACGDILRPDADQFEERGVAVVQLLPVGSSDVEGIAAVQRTSVQRELDITPTQVRIILSTDPVTVPDEAADGYEGYIQSGHCDSPTDEIQVELESEDDNDVVPFEAVSAESGDTVTVASYGFAGAPGFGLATVYADQDFSLVIEDAGSGEPVGCGDILEADADEDEEVGQALVQILPAEDAEDSGVQGYAVVQRVKMERELDVTPTLFRVLLFAPPAE